MTLALRRDGAFVVQYERVSARIAIQRTIELPTGVTVLVDDIRQLQTSSLTRVGTSFRARMDPAQGCIRNDLREFVVRGQIVSDGDVVAGYETVRVKAEETTLWFARQLGCAVVKSMTALPSGAVNEKVATLVAPGDPEEALFYIPERYTEVPPSVFHGLNPDSREARAMDASYFQRRPRK